MSITVPGHWSPWVGPDYEKRRLLLLGESFYMLEDEQGALWPPEIDQPVRLIEDAYSHPKFRYRFTTMIVRALTGREELVDEDWVDAWKGVAFTNYIPSVVAGRARSRPTPQQWRDGAAQWRALLEALRPQAIIVLGLTMWEAMPETAARIDRYRHSYRLSDGAPVRCLAVKHPAAGLSWTQLHEAITEIEQ